MARHPSGDPEMNRQHIEKQRQGDRELAENKPAPAPSEAALPPGRGRPDREEGVGTVQRQQR